MKVFPYGMALTLKFSFLYPNSLLQIENFLSLHPLKQDSTSRICQITGKKAMVGNSVSHSNRKTKRKFNPNLQEKRFFIPEEKKWITLKVSTSGIKIINKRGIY